MYPLLQIKTRGQALGNGFRSSVDRTFIRIPKLRGSFLAGGPRVACITIGPGLLLKCKILALENILYQIYWPFLTESEMLGGRHSQV